jgi:ABC-type antimicrobial peptide transport system permease subunit
VSLVLLVVGLIGCVVPLGRALRIQPKEALGVEG